MQYSNIKKDKERERREPIIVGGLKMAQLLGKINGGMKMKINGGFS
jgi:hypothetical protein